METEKASTASASIEQYRICFEQYRICFGWTDIGPSDVEIVDYHR